MERRVREETERFSRRERVAEAAGRMLGGALELVGELLPDTPETDETRRLRERIEATLAECVETDADGGTRLVLTLPRGPGGNGADDTAPRLAPVGALGRAIARLAAASSGV